MLFTFRVQVPANTPQTNPLRQELELKEGYITKISVLIPPGHQALAHLAILYGETPIIPWGENEWIEGDDDVLEWPESYELRGEPINLTAQAWNEDDTYPHTFYLRIWVEKEKPAAAPSKVEAMAAAMVKLVKRILGE